MQMAKVRKFKMKQYTVRNREGDFTFMLSWA